MRLLAKSLVRAVQVPDDLDARSDMMAAALMGATAFQKGLGGMHALSHPVGAVYDTHHGMTNATFMPYVLDFNREAIADRIARLAAYMDLPDASFEGFLRFVLALRQTIAVPHTLPELGVDDRQAQLIAEMAIVDPSASGNPVLLDLAGASRIFSAATHGRIG